VTDIELQVRRGLTLSPTRRADKPALLEYLNTRDIYETTLNIPFPYLKSHADYWLRRRAEQRQRLAKEVCFALRNSAGKLIGAISADSFEPGSSHKAEIGYWLAKPFWGCGIMTDAVRTYVDYAFHELGVVRLTAHTFEFNLASARVLEKNGFQLEGRLRKHLMKDGKLIDARFYGLLKEDLRRRQL
jgi:ribosomal-protein-alanine N-acetyltransferase